MAKILSVCFGFFGSFCLVFIFLVPSQGELILYALLLPLSWYVFRICKNICLDNLNSAFAPILAKKYTAILCAFCACLAGIYLTQPTATHATLNEQYESLLALSNAESLSCGWLVCEYLKEIVGFVLLKKAILDLMFAQAQGTLMQSIFACVYAFGHFGAFMSFSLLSLGGVRLDSQKCSIGFLPSFLCLLSFSFIMSFGTYLPPHSTLLSSKFATQNTAYIELYLQGMEVFIDVRDVDSINWRLQKQLDEFRSELDRAVFESIDRYFAHKDSIIEGYSQWYFSVYGEYTRLLYSAFGEGEQVAQDQFLALLEAYAPFDLQAELNGLYNAHIERLKNKIQQKLKLFSTQNIPSDARIESRFGFDDFAHKLDLLTPHKSDGISAILSASIIGGLILKNSGKILNRGFGKSLEKGAQKGVGRLVGKSVAKRGVSSAVGASGSVLCGAFAPLCAIGVFVASDFAINKIDQTLNEEAFKARMKVGIEEWELQLKNSLASYNSQLSEEILPLLPFENKTRHTRHTKE